MLDRAGEQAPVERVGGQGRRVLGGPEEAARRGARLVEPDEVVAINRRHAASSTANSASAAANRLSGASSATARASSMVSTSSSGRRIVGVRPLRPHAGELDGAGAFRAHRDAGEDGLVARLQADAPVAAVERHAERGAAVGHGAQALLEQLRRDLRRVHADEEGGLADVLERGGQALVQAVTALGDDFEARGKPRSRFAVEGDDAAGGSARGDRGGEGVRQRRACERGRLFRLQRRGQTSLNPTRNRLFGDHEKYRSH